MRRPRAVHGCAAPAGVRLRGRVRGEPLRQVHQGDQDQTPDISPITITCFVADAVPRWHEVQEEVRGVASSGQLMGRGDCVSMAMT